MVSESPCESVGGGVVAEFFRGLRTPKAHAIQWGGGGGSSRIFPGSAWSFFRLMGPFYIFFLSQRGGPESATARLQRLAEFIFTFPFPFRTPPLREFLRTGLYCAVRLGNIL